MAKLTGSEIEKQIMQGRIEIEPYNPENVGPNSVDLTLGNQLLVYEQLPLDMKQQNPTSVITVPPDGWVLTPGVLFLGVTQERAGSDFYVPGIEGRSSVARLGLFVHITAGFGDLGFKGHWTLEMVATHPIRIYAGTRICQIYFDTIQGDRAEMYDKGHHGKYGQQSEPVPIASRLFKDFR
jgi:dCTP deaminase